MKKILVAFASLVWAGFAVAGEYHVNDKLKCSQCHTMHAARSHSLSSGAVDARYPAAAQGTGHEFLLTYSSINMTCLACHDGAAGPDVFGSAATMTRSAGALNAVAGSQPGHTTGNAGDTAATAYDTWMGHTLGVLNPTIPGNNPVTTITGEFGCNNCHSVHGSASFRNLSAASGTAVTYIIAAAFDPNYDVTVVGTSTTTPGAVNSDATKDVIFGKGGTLASFRGTVAPPAANMNAFCAKCHGQFHGDKADATNGVKASDGTIVRHPVADAAGTFSDYAATNLMTGAQTDIVRPLWTSGQTSFQVGCLTCHKGHGNARGYGLVYPGPVTEGATYGANATAPGNAAIVDYEQGDGAIDSRGSYPIRNLCATCHRQSRARRSAIAGTP